MKKQIIFIPLLALTFLFSCKKKEDPQPEPAIKITSDDITVDGNSIHATVDVLGNDDLKWGVKYQLKNSSVDKGTLYRRANSMSSIDWFTYTPPKNYFGDVQLTYTVYDTEGNELTVHDVLHVGNSSQISTWNEIKNHINKDLLLSNNMSNTLSLNNNNTITTNGSGAPFVSGADWEIKSDGYLWFHKEGVTDKKMDVVLFTSSSGGDAAFRLGDVTTPGGTLVSYDYYTKPTVVIDSHEF